MIQTKNVAGVIACVLQGHKRMRGEAALGPGLLELEDRGVDLVRDRPGAFKVTGFGACVTDDCPRLSGM